MRAWRIGILAAAAATATAAALLRSEDPLRAPSWAAGSSAAPSLPTPGERPIRARLDALGEARAWTRSARTAARSDLACARGWVHALAVHAALPPLLTPAEELDRLVAAHAAADDPVSRQNAIFLAALTLPSDVAEAWLEALRAREDPEDAEDAACALAFAGEPGARADFLALAKSPSPAFVRRIVDTLEEHEAIGREGTVEARRTLRSYRAIEVLDRRPYFKGTTLYVRLRWLPRPRGGDHADGPLLAAWLARYPGHPGSDDMALRIGMMQPVPYDAARWFARAATLPDQDVTATAFRELVTTCEYLLSPSDVDRLANADGRDSPCRELLRYLRLRRIAAQSSVSDALHEIQAIALSEPDALVARAWRRRLRTPPPRGLDSGTTVLPADDALRAEVASCDPPASRKHLSIVERRLDPDREVPVLDSWRLERQFRAWEALAELELRARRAPRADRSDLLYKSAALLYHGPVGDWHGAFAPVYVSTNSGFAPRMHRARYAKSKIGEIELGRRIDRFEAESFDLLRAIAIFDAIEKEDGAYAGLDRVVFSRALARRRLLDFYPWCLRGDPAFRRVRHDAAVHALLADLERCATAFPESPLADDAARAADYWRRRRAAER